MISYNQLITVIENFASNHLQVKRFGAEFKEQLPNISTDGKSFPYLFMTPIGTTTGEFVKEIEVEIYCIDRLRKDRENTNDVISDTEQILTDLAVWLEDGQTLVDVVRSYSATPINNATLDYVDGWSQRFKFELERIAECEIPMTGNIDGISCPDFDYTITDADENILYSGTIPSGGSLTQEISSSEVTNSAGTVLATILAQDDAQLSDVNNVDTDGSIVPTPAGVPFTCTPASDATLTLNTNSFLTVASGSTTDISLIDQNDSDITPISVIGSTIKVNVPTASVTGLSSPIVVTGDASDGAIGRDFWEFPIVSSVQQLNHFGNKWRFTGHTGGYYDRDTSQFKDVNGTVTTKSLAFPDGLFIDHFTKDWNGDLVMYYNGDMLTTPLGIPSLTQPYAKANPPASVSTYSGNWNLANINQLTRLQYQGKMQEQPFSPGHGTVFIMSSTDAIGAANLSATYYLKSNTWYSGSDIQDKSTAAAGNIFAMYTRITNTSEL